MSNYSRVVCNIAEIAVDGHGAMVTRRHVIVIKLRPPGMWPCRLLINSAQGIPHQIPFSIHF